jgi:error-prone DNA polymerase
MGDTTLERLKNAWMERQFTSIADVVRRAKLDRGESLNMARAGAFSAWTEDRRHAAWEALRAAGNALPLAPASTGFHEPAPLDRDRLVLLDYYAVGLSLNGHPMEAGRERLRAAGAVSSADLESLPNGRTITVGGLVTIRQRPSTAGGTIFLLLEDEFGFINVVVPASLVPANEEVVKQALFVVVRGKLENDGATINVVGRQFKELEMEAIEHRSRNFH